MYQLDDRWVCMLRGKCRD